MQRIWISGYRGYELGTFGDKDPKITVIKYAIKQCLTNLLGNWTGSSLALTWALSSGARKWPWN